MDNRYRCLSLILWSGIVAAWLAGPAAAEEPRGGDPVAKQIAELLQPTLPAPVLPRERPVPMPPRKRSALENPAPVPPHDGGLAQVQVPLPPSQTQPRPPQPAAPLARERTDRKLPQLVALPEGPLLALPGPDVQRPIPVPVLAQLRPERAPFTDPTRDASMEAALAGAIAPRTTPAPFERLNLPDPFEYRAAVGLGAAPPEALGLSPLPPRAPPKNLPEKGPVRSASR